MAYSGRNSAAEQQEACHTATQITALCQHFQITLDPIDWQQLGMGASVTVNTIEIASLLDLRQRGADVRRYVATLEEWIIRTLAACNVRGERREDRIGVWVRRPELGAEREDKIAAIGIRVQRWVTLHGIALNVDCDLSHFSGIVPCGVSDPRYGVTSIRDLGLTTTMAEVDTALRRCFEELFGPTALHAVGNTENSSPGRRSAKSSGVPAR